MPTTIDRNTHFLKLNLLPLRREITVADNRYPNRYPPVGPNNAAGPPAPPENTGIPISPNSKNTPIVVNTCLGFNRKAIRLTIIVWAVILASEKGRGIIM